MSKELTALEVFLIIKDVKLTHMTYDSDENYDGEMEYEAVEVDDGSIEDNLYDECKIVETALKRLEKYEKVFEELNLDISDDVDLKNWIKLAQFHYENKNNKLKALEIIKKRKVRIGLLFHCDNASQYNHEIEFNGSEWQMLTQEEFDLLKGVLL